MSASIKVTPKKRGRPATGRDPHLTLRVEPSALADLDLYCAHVGVNRSEVVREALDAWREKHAPLLRVLGQEGTDDVAKLKKLRDTGVITGAEFDRRLSELLI